MLMSMGRNIEMSVLFDTLFLPRKVQLQASLQPLAPAVSAKDLTRLRVSC